MFGIATLSVEAAVDRVGAGGVRADSASAPAKMEELVSPGEAQV